MFSKALQHPDIANSTRKLPKANDGVNTAMFKELLCLIKFVLDTKNFGLKLKPNGNVNKSWEIVCFSDSNYVGVPVSRKRVSGFILYVLFRCNGLLAIKSPEESDAIELRD